MADISELIEQFVSDIKTTEAYLEYEKQKERIKAYPDLKNRIDQFRQQNYEIQNNTDPEYIFDRVDAFQKENEAFREIPMVHDFLAAELDYCRMIQEINERIYKEFAIDFE
jgi:cell fate (sporulation/competence/biofilm development) regulator YlbF (YheA/YmcA/DUF963 family)